MELNISDLLDDLGEVNIDIRPHTTTSESRIKELTMKKMQASETKPIRHRGMGFLGKVLIAAVIITTLAVPVLAASGAQFTDWIEGILTPGNERADNYDNDLLEGAESKKWAVSGWVLDISAEGSSGTGLTFVCEELGSPNKSGTLTTDQGYWLEQWNGTEYAAMEGSVPGGTAITIADGAAERWTINWESIYGKLDSGSYRIGKTFTYTSDTGKQEQMAYYAKFRIFTGEMEPLLEKYAQAYEELHGRESYHITWTHYATDPDDYSHHFTNEIWKNGGDYLEITSYYNADGSLKSHRGYLLRDSVGYKLSWENGNVHAQVTAWKAADFVEQDSFDLWYHFMSVNPAILGEVHDKGNTLCFIEYNDFINEAELEAYQIEDLNENSPYWNHDYYELTYTFDDSRRITNIQYTRQTSLDPAQSNAVVEMILAVHDTAPEDIANIIESQNVSDPPPFSWVAEQTAYADSAITEGFANTEAQTMDGIQAVIDRARNEADPTANPRYRDGCGYNVSDVYFDEDTNMWKVIFTHSQDADFVLNVYLNSDGVTQMIVYP